MSASAFYTYVGNDPTDKTDPSGEVTFSVGFNITAAAPLEATGMTITGGSGEVGVAISIPFFDGAKLDAGVYGTGGTAHGLGFMAGPSGNISGGSVSDMSTHGKVDTQGVLAAGPVGVAVSLEGKTTGSLDLKAVKNMTPKQVIKAASSLLGGHKKIAGKGVGGFVGVTQTKTVTYTVRDFFKWLGGK